MSLLQKKEFTLSTLQKVKQNRIGGGQIGGKAAGMLLAWSILKKRIPAKINPFRIPESFYLGSNIMYDFMSYNELIEWLYQPLSQIKTKFPEIQRQFMKGKFPPQILNSLRYRLEQIGSQPLVIRSSSLLEDSFGKSLSGMYETVFCPNQGSIDENLNVVCQSIARIYASYFKPDNLSIPINLGENYLAVLIQLVQGERFDQFYLPHGAGIAFSRNLYRWSPQIRKKDGFVRLVWGLGTRAGERSYDQVFNDYPRLVALSHPLLQPTASTRKIDHYSQHYVDLLDLKENKFKTLPVTDLIRLRYPFLRNIVQVDEGGYLTSLHTNLVNKQHLVITFDEFLNRTAFAEHMRNALKMIEKKYGFTVEIEFSVQIELDVFHPIVQITLLQCRPKTALGHDSVQSLNKIKTNDVVFSTSRMVPSGIINEIRYVLFVPPEEYYSLATPYDRTQLEQAIGSLNKALDGENFVCVGPGRWGTSTSDLGIHIKFGDICNTRALIELSGQGIFSAPEFSFGTHFFQDLLAWRIALLAINLDDKDVIFNRDFFYSTPNCLGKWIPVNNALIKTLRLINVEDYHSNHLLTLAMNGVRDNEQAVAFLVSNDQ